MQTEPRPRLTSIEDEGVEDNPVNVGGGIRRHDSFVQAG